MDMNEAIKAMMACVQNVKYPGVNYDRKKVLVKTDQFPDGFYRHERHVHDLKEVVSILVDSEIPHTGILMDGYEMEGHTQGDEYRLVPMGLKPGTKFSTVDIQLHACQIIGGEDTTKVVRPTYHFEAFDLTRHEMFKHVTQMTVGMCGTASSVEVYFEDGDEVLMVSVCCQDEDEFSHIIDAETAKVEEIDS